MCYKNRTPFTDESKWINELIPNGTIYRKSNKKRIGIKCMVFPDYEKTGDGSRVLFGVIVNVNKSVVTVKITESSYNEWRKYDILSFPEYQIWAEDYEDKITQLSLF